MRLLVFIKLMVQFFILLVILIAQVYGQADLLNFYYLIDLITKHPDLVTMLHIEILQLAHEPHEFLASHLHITPFFDRLTMCDVKVPKALIKLHLTLLEFLKGAL